MAPKRPRDDSGEQHNDSSGPIFESSPIKDRSSTFIAAFSPGTSIAPKTLQARPEYASASHRVLAWRRPSKQQRLAASSASDAKDKVLYEIGSDDDGEKYAGKKLEKVLAEMDVQGVLVVARWYGGVLLGPVRFTHIENVAREAITKWRTGGDGGKRVKIENHATDAGEGEANAEVDPEEEQRQKEALAKQLENRDSNIVVLRGLLAEKQKEANGGSQESQSQTQKPRVAPPLDYTRMPLPALKKLEKARDATVAWILKQLDDAEAEAGKTAA